MSNLTRWEPMRDMVTLRDAMDRLFDEAFTPAAPAGNGGRAPMLAPSSATITYRQAEPDCIRMMQKCGAWKTAGLSR